MVITLHRNGQTEALEASEGANLYRALREAGVGIDAPCGGRCFCGKCAVRVEGGGDVLAGERDFLTPAQIASGWRLACAVTVSEDMQVYLAGASDASIQIEGIEGDGTFDPAVTVCELELRRATLEDASGEFERARECTGAFEAASIDTLATLRKPFAALYDGKRILTGSDSKEAYGVAFDIGTTTVVGYLMDLSTGVQMGVESSMNAQRAYGADVISRCTAAATKEGLSGLTAAIRGQLRDMTAALCSGSGVDAGQVYHIAIAGNTVMLHLLAGVPVDGIAVSPFAPVFTQGFDFPSGPFGLGCPNAVATLLPCIAGYVGADIVAAAMACGMDLEGPPRLLLDIGTNGEMLLAADGKLLCCSTAAGPAFEGAHIACGVGGVRGAISKVSLRDGSIATETVGGGTPVGICGSGLVDAVAALLDAYAVDETGRLDEEYLPDRHFELDGKGAFRLTDEVYLTQKDLREVQLAKSAIAAGVEILLREAGLKAEDVAEVYLAGGFGSHIDPISACRIGLMPKALLGAVRAVGNAAGAGARIALLNKNARERAEAIRRNTRAVELSLRPDFQDLYVDNMLFEG